MDYQQPTDSRLSNLLGLWREKCGDSGLPDRTCFTPEVLRSWLGSLALIDVADGQYRYRLYGSNFVYRFGIEMTGRVVDDLPREQASAVRRDYDTVVRTRQPLIRLYTGGFDIIDLNRRIGTKRVETWERLVLPLSCSSREVDMLLVAAYELSAQIMDASGMTSGFGPAPI
ncbi:MAG: PAS domain-containing protein [Rhodospirillaceae bacterium]